MLKARLVETVNVLENAVMVLREAIEVLDKYNNAQNQPQTEDDRNPYLVRAEEEILRNQRSSGSVTVTKAARPNED